MYLVLFAIISPQQAVGRDNLSKPAGQWMKGKHKTKLDSGSWWDLSERLLLCASSSEDRHWNPGPELKGKKNTPDQSCVYS